VVEVTRERGCREPTRLWWPTECGWFEACESNDAVREMVCCLRKKKKGN